MYTVRGLVKNGAILLDEPVSAREGEAVLVTFMATAGHRSLPGLEDVVAEIIALGPNPQTYIPPTVSLAGLLANAASEYRSTPRYGIGNGLPSRRKSRRGI